MGCRLFQVGTLPSSLPLGLSPRKTSICTSHSCHFFLPSPVAWSAGPRQVEHWARQRSRSPPAGGGCSQERLCRPVRPPGAFLAFLAGFVPQWFSVGLEMDGLLGILLHRWTRLLVYQRSDCVDRSVLGSPRNRQPFMTLFRDDLLNSFLMSPDVSVQTIACRTVLQSAFWRFVTKDQARIPSTLPALSPSLSPWVPAWSWCCGSSPAGGVP